MVELSMPIECTFKLNGRPMSALSCGSLGAIPAFSGQGEHRNRAGSTAVAGQGPLPAGRYFIVRRVSGGRLGWLWDAIAGSDKDEWFALYRDDGEVDDVTFVNRVERGAFRLHPAGPMGVSEGCVTVVSAQDYARLRQALLSARGTVQIGNTSMEYYGTVTVE